MPRGLDHIVHAVRDLDAAAETYRRLGFTVGARNRHPWGTHNCLVQFPGFFIELLTLAEPDKLGDDGFSRLFGRYTGEFLERQEGLALMILESRDATADEAQFRATGIAASQTMRFEREGRRPDGSPVKVGFSLAFAENKQAPAIHFAVCQQHYPENFWNSGFSEPRQRRPDNCRRRDGGGTANAPPRLPARLHRRAGGARYGRRFHHRAAARRGRCADARCLQRAFRRRRARRFARGTSCRNALCHA